MLLDSLILECKNNKPKAQEQIYQLFSPKLFGVCLKYSSDYADAEDNLQDGFLIIFRKIDQYSGKGSFEGWAKRIMINNALQKFRAVRHLEILSENTSDVELDIDEETLSLDYLLTIIQALPDQYRIVFNLYVLDGYSHKEISQMLAISVGASKSNLHRARHILKEKIEKSPVTTLESSVK